MKLTDVTKFNEQSGKEEAANGISHGAGALLAIGGTAVLVVFSAISGSGVSVVSSAIYGFSLILLFTMSTLYHSRRDIKIKKIFQILDHSSVYILIWGTYTPICLSLLGTKEAYGVWFFLLGVTLLGILFNIINLRKFHILSMVLYLVMGWSAVFIMEQMLAILPWAAIFLLIGGGIAYSVGVFFYLVKGPKYMHLVWHIFVIVGAVSHYFFVLLYAV